MAKQEATQGVTAAAEPVIKKIPTGFKHVYLVDINDDGRLREVAVLKEDGSGSLVYIDVALLDIVDKGRLKKIISSVHADKYKLWELMDMERLSNGVNGLDYFHQMARTKTAPGYVNTAMGGGLGSVRAEKSTMIGAGFTDPSSGTIDA